jgi:hypothetical protein
MGFWSKQLSQNVVDQMINASVNMFIDMSQSAIQKITEEQRFQLRSQGGDINITGVDMSQLAQIDLQALKQDIANVDVSQSLKDQIDQIAKNTTQMFGMPNDQETDNIAEEMLTVATNIKEDLSQTCVAEVSQLQTVDFDSGGGNITLSFFDMNQVTNSLVNCVKGDSNYTKMVQKLETSISQVAENKVDSILALLAAIVIVVIVVIGAVIFKGTSALTNPKTLLAIGALIILVSVIYLFIASKKKWFPYDNDSDNGPLIDLKKK